MNDFDDQGNEVHYCPNDCDYENLLQDLQDETSVSPTKSKSFIITCWNCKKETIDPNKEPRDKVKVFGYICPKCNCSIREDKNLLISIAKRLGISAEEWRIKYLKEMVDDLLTLPK